MRDYATDLKNRRKKIIQYNSKYIILCKNYNACRIHKYKGKKFKNMRYLIKVEVCQRYRKGTV